MPPATSEALAVARCQTSVNCDFQIPVARLETGNTDADVRGNPRCEPGFGMCGTLARLCHFGGKRTDYAVVSQLFRQFGGKRTPDGWAVARSVRQRQVAHHEHAVNSS